MKNLEIELKKNSIKNGKKLAELLKEYELIVLGEDLQEQMIKECYEKVLAENVFLSDQTEERLNIKKGQRITKDCNTIFLSKADQNRLENLVIPLLVKENITDKDGYYIVKWHTKKAEAKNALVDFYIDNIVPKSMRQGFENVRRSYIYQEKLLKIIKEQFV